MRLTTTASTVLALLFLGSMLSVSGQELPGFQRGDCNGDGSRNISDAISVLQYVVGAAGEPPCLDACDADDSGGLNLADVITTLNTIFLGPLVFPTPDGCGVDPTSDVLDCVTGNCVLGTLREEAAFTLESGRVGLPYYGELPQVYQAELYYQVNGGPQTVYQEEVLYTEFGFTLDQELPDGLVLDPVSGAVSGDPGETGFRTVRMWARHPDGDLVLYHVDVAVFSAAETELVPDQGLGAPGSFIPGIYNSFFNYTHQLEWPPPVPLYNCSNTDPPPPTVQEPKGVTVTYPINTSQPLPVLFFHHGTGFDWSEYSDIFIDFASRGIITVTVNDPFSYFGFTNYYCWGGHDEAAGVMLATRDLVRAWDADPAHVLHERVDWTRVFYAGHSRGGGSATICAELDRNTRGLLILQGTDAKQDALIGNTSRWVSLPDVPVMSISAEQDFDVIYPYAERLLERYAGPTSMVTIYGGCHGFTTDASNNGCDLCDYEEIAPWVDRCRYIRRDVQHDWIKELGTAFLVRYGFGDVSLEGLLHGPELEASPHVSIAYRRNLAEPILVDDFSGYPVNALGFTMTSTGMLLIDTGTCYDTPFPLPNPIAPIDNLVMILPDGLATVTEPLGTLVAPLDVGNRKRLTFRVKNHDVHALPDNFGFSWLDLTVTLSDADGDGAPVVIDSHLPSLEFHPDPEPPTVPVRMKYQRFMTVTLDLDEFLAVNPALDLSALVELQFEWLTDGTQDQTPRFGLDDVQFE